MARLIQTHRRSSGGKAHGGLIRFALRMGSKFSIGKLPFKRLVRGVAKDIKAGLRFKNQAMLALQVAAEEYLEDMFYQSDLCAVKAKRVTVMLEDIQSARRISGERA